ncbi:MAG: DUF721 domain-containing protein [Gammaproteobacteria bacterium]
MDQTRRANKCKSIESLVSAEPSPLQNLVKKAQRIQQLGRKLESRLDPSFQGHFTLANINDGVAIILANSSAWATRLRYHIPDILDELTNQLGQGRVKTVRIKIAPTHQEIIATGKKQNKLSREAASYLIRTADDFGDSPIRDTLLSIARHYTAED